MKITVTTLSDAMFTLEVSEDMELENFKALCEFELGIPSQELGIVWDGRPLQDNKKKLKDYGIKDNEVLLVQQLQGAFGVGAGSRVTSNSRQGAVGTGGDFSMIDFSQIHVPGSSSSQQVPPPEASLGDRMPDDPAVIRAMLLANPDQVALLKERNPPLATALLSGSVEKFAEVLAQQKAERVERDRAQIAMLNSNPCDADVQRKIAEQIRLQNVEQNMATAMEYVPESFGQVVMLYIDCLVNGHHVKAFVDSGAQMTIMSQACAERCNIMRLVDTRWAGVAKGVGTQKIIGRVHLGQIQIGSDYLQSSFSILEEQPMDMLLGLDMLKRHQCSIDLKKNILVIGTTGTETSFLAESELPEYARLNRQLSSGSDQDLGDRQLAEALARSAEEAGGSTSSNFPEESIKVITSAGFTRQQAIEELQNTNGNAQQALLALLAKSIQVPSK